MAGTECSEKPILKLTLLVDTEKNKFVFADVGKDFVDVLFGFLALPMGTIVRLLERYKQNPAPVGCFNNLYKSVVDMDKDDFMTEACKDMLLYPRETLIRLGYNDISRLKTISVDVNHQEVITFATSVEMLLLLSLLNEILNPGYNSSETPFTDVFLKKHISCGMTRSHDMPTLPVQDGGEDGVMSLTVFVRKQDMKVLYAESGQDFVVLLFIFLAVPLESVWEITGRNIELGCIDNFCRNMKSLSSSGGTNASNMLPWQYSFHKSLIMDDDVEADLVAEPTLSVSSGFVKKGSTFLISNDLTITASNSSSTIRLLKKLDTNLDHIEEQVISITGAEAINLLKASLVTSTDHCSRELTSKEA